MAAVSVIVPVYNAAPYLAQCMESLLMQTCTELEVILVDDGSTDGSGALCDGFAARDARVRVLHQENRGVVAARRNGVHLAQSVFVGFVDSDDWVEPEMFASLLTAIESNDLAICGMTAEPSGKPCGGQVCSVETPQGRVWQFYDAASLRWRLHPSVCNKLFRREMLLSVQERLDDRVTFGEDAAVTLPYLLQTARIGTVKESLYHYRQRRDSLTHVYDSALPERIAALEAVLRRAFDGAAPLYATQLQRYFGYLWVLTAKNEARGEPNVRARANRLREIEPSRMIPGGGFCIGNYDNWLLFLLRHRLWRTASALLEPYRRTHMEWRGRTT